MPRGRPPGSKNKPKPVELFDNDKSVSPELDSTLTLGQPRNAKQDPSNHIEIINTIPTNNINTSGKTISSAPNAQRARRVTGICNLCGTELYSGPIVIQLNSLTGCASWHRDCKIDRIKVCNECAHELNKLIDNFMLKKNPSLYKWGDYKGADQINV